MWKGSIVIRYLLLPKDHRHCVNRPDRIETTLECPMDLILNPCFNTLSLCKNYREGGRKEGDAIDRVLWREWWIGIFLAKRIVT